MTYVILLGAGASASEGAPIQRDLFRTYFREATPADLEAIGAAAVKRLFERMFAVRGDGLAGAADLPTFEEVLGMLDIAVARGEGLRGLPLGARADETAELRQLRQALILVLADAIRRQVRPSPSHHAMLVESLKNARVLERVTFISLNYDVSIDTALYDVGTRMERVVDYGFRPAREGEIDGGMPLFKIHGSLNWLYCPVCTDLRTTFGRDIITRIINEPASTRCTRCDTPRQPVIVPPTYYKDLSNVHLAGVWNRSANALRNAAVLIVCGYSLPDADMHVKYLIKAAQMNRAAADNPLRIKLVNMHGGKDPLEHAHEVSRYTRFFGPAAVSDEAMSFEQFVRQPTDLL